MPDFLYPLWLLGLGALPVIWWLHRFQKPERTVRVSALFLWRRAPAETAAGHVPVRTDPRWMLRALLFTCLLLALANPTISARQSRPVTVWFDDSISMHALENGSTRTRVAVARLFDALQQEAITRVTVRSLGNHGAALDLSATRPGAWRSTLSDWLDARPPAPPRHPATLPAAMYHWVVSDGSDTGINDWLRTAPVNRVILAGQGGENTAITRLSLRRSLTSPGSLLGSVTVRNTGGTATRRTLEIHAQDRLVSAATLDLLPGVDARHDFTLPSGGATLSARLLPADALALDDALAVSLDDFGKTDVSLGGGCGNHLRTVLAAHPGLRLTHEEPGQEVHTGASGITVDCSGTPLNGNGPVVVTHPASSSLPVAAAPHWHAEAGDLGELMLERDWLAATDPGTLPAGRIPLLSAGSTPLLLASTPPGIVDVFIDLESPALVRRPVYPLLVNGLLELALGRTLLDPVVAAERDIRESTIEPRLKNWHRSEAMQLPDRYAGTRLAPWLTVLAALLVLIDTGLLGRPPAGRLPAG